MPETVKERNKRWFPVVIACALLIGAAMWASVLIPQGSERAAVPEVTDGESFPQVLSVRYGRLVRLTADGVTVLEEYDVDVLTLPAEERERLANGVRVVNEEELVGLIENYTS